MIAAPRALPPVPSVGTVDSANGDIVIVAMHSQFSKIRALNKMKVIWILGTICLVLGYILDVVGSFLNRGAMSGVIGIFTDALVLIIKLLIWRVLCEVTSIWYDKNKKA